MLPGNNHSQCVTHADRCRLGYFLDRSASRAWGNRSCRANLRGVLEQAESVEARAAPDNLVTMNSRLRLTELASKKQRTVTLVYPDEADLAFDGLSILEPLGTALLGRKPGHVVQCPAKACQQQFRIDEVVYQPEHAGAYHL